MPCETVQSPHAKNPRAAERSVRRFLRLRLRERAEKSIIIGMIQTEG